MIDLKKNAQVLERAVQRARDRNIIIPTFEEQKKPKKFISQSIIDDLKEIGLWEVAPRNLFRITWHNEPKEHGGGFADLPNYIELPPELTGVDARIIVLVGKWFPTGAHKVGAAYGCLVPRLVTGQFDPTTQKAVWPSTGNYCRGGAFDSALLACESIAILPEEMSRERFEWLKTVSGETITTPGGESNVKEIFDKCWELRKERGESAISIFNQFDEFGNHLWHYEITGNAMKQVLEKELGGGKYRGVCLTTGSAGTIGVGDFMKEEYPTSMIAAGESLQCPTLLNNGYGYHRIEGIGDKHVPWIHNVKNTDLVIAIDDKDCMNLIRLFNEPAGHEYLKEQGVPEVTVDQLHLLGISSMANVLMAIKMAKYYEMTQKDVVLTVFTDSMELYQSRVQELRSQYGNYSDRDAAIDFHRSVKEIKTDNLLELRYTDKKRIHNLKYFTWIEQQGKNVEELDRQWYDYDNHWNSIHQITPEIDQLINEFNEKVGIQ
ncbi:MAG: pyridoxal-5-phosphate-dependent protein subunit beta [Candidatus Hodarchaeales archaeon]|jgi:cysteine synthase